MYIPDETKSYPYTIKTLLFWVTKGFEAKFMVIYLSNLLFFKEKRNIVEDYAEHQTTVVTFRLHLFLVKI
jgi:hypothetical protein